MLPWCAASINGVVPCWLCTLNTLPSTLANSWPPNPFLHVVHGVRCTCGAHAICCRGGFCLSSKTHHAYAAGLDSFYRARLSSSHATRLYLLLFASAQHSANNSLKPISVSIACKYMDNGVALRAIEAVFAYLPALLLDSVCNHQVISLLASTQEWPLFMYTELCTHFGKSSSKIS